MTKLQQFKRAIQQVIVGKDEMIEQLAVALLAKGHVLLEDVPGTGKTKLAKTVATVIGGTFHRIQMTPDVMPSDVVGLRYFNPKTSEFEEEMGPIFANILLVDELNRTMPRTQASLLEAMEEYQVTLHKQTMRLPEPFFVIATQNPLDQQGTFPLPEAQLDRFMMVLQAPLPSAEEELALMRRFREHDPLVTLAETLSPATIKQWQEEVSTVALSEAIELYMLQLIRATRQHAYVEHGASPRATLAFMRAVQARALLHDRTYVIPEDVKALFGPVLAHRILLTLDGSLRSTKEEILADILANIDVPVEVNQ